MPERKIDYTELNMTALGYTEEDTYEGARLDDSTAVTNETITLLEDCDSYWQSLSPVRDRRERNRNYYRGYQWNDPILDPDDEKTKTEEEYLLARGKQPLINNQLRQIVKNLLGQFRDNDYKPQARSRKRADAKVSEMMTNAIQYVYDINKLKEVDTREFEEFLMSGIICWKSTFEEWHERDLDDVKENRVNPNYLFWNTETRDIRGDDINLIGEIIDAPLEEIVSAFARTPEEEAIIKKWYGDYESRRPDAAYFQDSQREDSMDFRYPLDDRLCRYFEIWKLKYKKKVICHDWLKGTMYQHPLEIDEAIEQVEMENNQRLMDAWAQYSEQGLFIGNFEEFLISEFAQQIPLIEYEIKPNHPVWCFYMLTPEGYILDSGESPYEHQQHPYTLRLFPLIDGEVWGFMEDIIDQQKMINRMITLIDWVISSGAKGAWMVPEDVIPEGMSREEFAKQSVAHNGMIYYQPKKHGQKPEPLKGSALPAGATELLNIQLGLIKEISGVNEAIQGQKPAAGTPASRYAMETQNATISSKDYFEHFFSARKDRDYKILKLIKQFYTEERHINVAGIDYEDAAAIYDPELVQDLDFDIVIGKSPNAPVYRMLIDERLDQLLQLGAIDVGMYLENTSMPFADKLLQQIKEKRDAMEAQGIDPIQLEIINQQQNKTQ